jgi:hypothetical protein
MRRRLGRRENPSARRADALEVHSKAPQEKRLADDRREAPPLGFEDTEDRAIDRLGLLARIHRLGGGLAAEEQLPGLGALHPTQDDRATMGLDRFEREMVKHCDPLTGSFAAHAVAGVKSVAVRG